MTRNPSLATLVAAVVLALATVVCSLAHVAAPDFLPYAVVALIGVAVPTPGSAQTAADAPATPPAPVTPVPPAQPLSDAFMPTAAAPRAAPAAIIPGPSA